MGNFKDLGVWAKAHALTLEIYKATQKFPREEIFGLTAQMRRAGNSIGTNLAEGCGRKSDPGSGDSFISQWDQQPNWSTTCY